MSLDTIRQLMADFADVPLKTITPETSLASLNLDSLDMVEILMAVEIEYSITVPNDDAVKIKTVQDAAALVDSLL